MRKANEGVSLAAIVAKETTTGKWSGLGTGIGLGTGGIGLFIGGMAGSKQEQTQRAKNFESPKPKEEEYSLLNVYSPIIKVLVLEELSRVEREAAKTKLRIDVYNRLRYVESDHIVFDPLTGHEVLAEPLYITKLIDELAQISK